MLYLATLVVYAVGALLLFKVLQMLIGSLLAYSRLGHYRKQGLDTHFFPGVGFFHLYLGLFKVNRSVSNCEHLKAMMKQGVPPTSIISNFPGLSTPIVFLCSADHVKEFYLKEVHFEKHPGDQQFFEGLLGFFFKDGPRAMQTRSVFSKIFAFEGLAAMSGDFCSILRHSFEEFDRAHEVTSQKFEQVSLDRLLKPVMRKVFSVLMFGKRGLHRQEKYSEFYRLSEQIMASFFAVFFNPVYIMFPWLSGSLKLAHQLRTIDRCKQRLKDILRQELRERMAEDPASLEECIFDRIVAHNWECAYSGRP